MFRISIKKIRDVTTRPSIVVTSLLFFTIVFSDYVMPMLLRVLY